MKDCTGGIFYDDLIENLNIRDLKAIKKLLLELGDNELFLKHQVDGDTSYERFNVREYIEDSIMHDTYEKYNKELERNEKIKSLFKKIIKK